MTSDVANGATDLRVLRGPEKAPLAFTLIDTLITIVIIAVLAAIVVPKYKDASQIAMETNVASQLKTIRTQIEHYNSKHAATPFSPLIPGGPSAWNQLVQNDYLHEAPKNPLQSNSISVGAAPGFGVAWVWADPFGTGATIYAVDSIGNYFDFDDDGIPD